MNNTEIGKSTTWDKRTDLSSCNLTLRRVHTAQRSGKNRSALSEEVEEKVGFVVRTVFHNAAPCFAHEFETSSVLQA